MPRTVTNDVSIEFHSSAKVGSTKQTKYFRFIATDTATYGDNLPDWRQRISNCSSATTSLTGTRVKVKKAASIGFLQSSTTNLFPTQAKIDIQATGDFFPLVPLTNLSGVDSSLETSVKTAFLSACYSEQHKLQSLVILGELGQTIKLIRSPFKSFYNALRDYLSFLKGKKGRYNTLSRRQRFLSDSWLEFSLGILPFISDIKSGAEALEQLAFKPTILFVSRKGKSQNLQPLGNGAGNFDQLAWRWVRYCKHEYDVRYYGALRSLPNSPVVGVASTFGFDPRSFVPSIYNLIPYSFLLDYFANVNEFLESYMFNTALLGWANRGVRGVHTSFPGEVKLDPFSWSSPVIGKTTRHSLSAGVPSVVQTIVSRSALAPGDLIPSISFRMPFAPAWKAANVVALLNSHRAAIPF